MVQCSSSVVVVSQGQNTHLLRLTSYVPNAGRTADHLHTEFTQQIEMVFNILRVIWVPSVTNANGIVPERFWHCQSVDGQGEGEQYSQSDRALFRRQPLLLSHLLR